MKNRVDFIKPRNVLSNRWENAKKVLPEHSGKYLTYRRGVFEVLPYSERWQKFGTTDFMSRFIAEEKAVEVSHWIGLDKPEGVA